MRFSGGPTTGSLTILTVAVIAAVTYGVYVMYKKAPERADVNARFVKIIEFCNANPKFEWKHGDDAPIGFVEESQFTPI